MKICPKCRRQTDSDRCDSCSIIFAEYEQNKTAQTAMVYKLISAGDLEKAKVLAHELAEKFPDSRSDFILLTSNINRDISIAEKYRQAKELYHQGDYREACLLLRTAL